MPRLAINPPKFHKGIIQLIGRICSWRLILEPNLVVECAELSQFIFVKLCAIFFYN